MSLKTVTAAIDLSNDGNPDVLITAYCCDDPTRPPESGNEDASECGTTYAKFNRVWRVIEELEPE
jgi:hypothetical protein